MTIDFQKEGRPLPHTWSNCVGAGRANEGLMSVYPDQTAARECQNSGEKRPFDFTITGLRPGDTYLLRILRSKDSAVGLWNRMEAPVSPTREQTEHLRRQGEVMEEIPVKAENSGSLHLSFLLDPWSIAEIG